MAGLRHLLASNMKKHRRILGISQAKLAEKVSTAPTYIAMIELEKKFPSVDMLERIASALAIEPPELFSASSFPAESIKCLHTAVLTEFDKVINAKLKELEKKD
jgi:transcriptional regulator with XRE-family HTH domain